MFTITKKAAGALSIATLDSTCLLTVEGNGMEPDARFTDIGKVAYYTGLKSKLADIANTSDVPEKQEKAVALHMEVSAWLSEKVDGEKSRLTVTVNPESLTAGQLLEFIYFYDMGGGKLNKPSSQTAASVLSRAKRVFSPVIHTAYKYFCEEKLSNSEQARVVNAALELNGADKLPAISCRKVTASAYVGKVKDRKKLSERDKFNDLKVIQTLASEYVSTCPAYLKQFNK